MNVSDVVRGPKTDVEISEWRAGHIPRERFPLSRARAKSNKLGPEYRWRVIKFDCLGDSFRVLVVFNEAKQIYRATLAVERQEGRQQELAVLCQNEYHASEPGWHCHVTFAEIDTLPLGVVRSHLRRWPQVDAAHSRPDFGVHERNAATIAAARFRISSPGTLLSMPMTSARHSAAREFHPARGGVCAPNTIMGPDGDPLTVYLRRDAGAADSLSGWRTTGDHRLP